MKWFYSVSLRELNVGMSVHHYETSGSDNCRVERFIELTFAKTASQNWCNFCKQTR